MKIKNVTLATLGLLAPAALQAQTAPASDATASVSTSSSAPAYPHAEDVIVTGTRQQGRTKQQSPAPVDVISAKDLQATGQQNVFDALNVALPAFDLPAFASDTSGLVRSARLRGLSPDDVLVLVDGKRRHVSSNLNTDIGPSGGSDPVDFDMIPISMIDHIEVLRDGAAAQYGSDAIAGVINIILKHADHGGSAYAQEGATYVQDGFTNNLGVNQGIALGSNGFFDLGMDYRYHDHTNRSGNFPSPAALAANGDTLVPGPRNNIPIPANISQIEGDPRYNLFNVGYNAGYTVSPELELYSFGTYAYRHSEAFENFRDPNVNGNYAPGSNIIPGTATATFAGIPAPYNYLTASKYFPSGFMPIEASNEDDYSVSLGAKGDVFGDWHYDLSTTYGADINNISVLDTVNSDFLHVYGYSPTKFHAGEFNDSEWTSTFDLSKPFDVPIFAKPLNVAMGAEYRHNTYQIQPGDTPDIFEGSSSGYAGFSKQDSNYYERSNEAVYIDVATYLLENWQVDGAGRYEHYSDFGSTETGKFTTRYDFSPAFAVRGTISNGFRAPSLAQQGYSGVNVGPNSASGALPVNSVGAVEFLGAKPLKPERSQNYSVGFVATPIEHMHVALDLYQIDIRDQIVSSGGFGGTPALEAFVADGFSLPTGVSPSNVTANYFTNGVKTRTRGADLTVDYATFIGDYGKINWLLAANFNSTSILHQNAAAALTPDVLSEIKESTPKSKIILQAVYQLDPVSLTLRETRFGQVIEVYSFEGSGGGPFTANRNAPHFISDIEIGYKITKDVSFTLGANNLFDTYANHSTFDSRIRNAEMYISASPYGIDGGFYYGRLNINWGDAPPPPAPMPEPPPAAAPVPVPVRTYLVFFDWDRADLTVRAKQIVASAAEASTHVQTTQIEVNGYTDLSGTPAYNQKLSVRRAMTVKAELVHDGVAPGEIDIHGFGETHPLVPTAKGVREPQNRRVEIILK